MKKLFYLLVSIGSFFLCGVILFGSWIPFRSVDAEIFSFCLAFASGCLFAYATFLKEVEGEPYP